MDKTQDSKRRHFSPHEKAAAVKRHLLERVPISAICEELKIAPNLSIDGRRNRSRTRICHSRRIAKARLSRQLRIARSQQDRRSQDRNNQPSLERLGYNR